MESSVIESIVLLVTHIIAALGYPGIIALMAIESALIPLPSEVIMPFSGFLVSQGKFSLLGVALAGAFGNLIGSWIAYAIGYFGHERLVKKLVRKYGKFILLTEEEFDSAVNLFHKYGQWVALVARVLPAVRTVISLPAGISKLPFFKFSLLTFVGSFIWSFILAYIGVKLGENWEIIRPYFRKFDMAIIFLIIITVAAYVYYKLFTRGKRKLSAPKT